MSTNYEAVTVIGVVLKESDLYYDKNVRGCLCTLTQTGANFCSECGRPIWVTKKTPITIYDPSQSTLDGTEVCPINNVLGEFIGVGLFRKGDVNLITFAEITPDFLERLKNTIRAMLLPLGLWSENMFGVHTLLHIY